MNEKLLDFIHRSPSAFHAVENVARELLAAGYCELFESEGFSLEPGGRYFVRRNGSSLIAFRLPSETDFPGFMLMAAHSDSPCFKLKASPTVTAGPYAQLRVEKYGGMLCAGWLDRPLSVAGRVIVREGGRLCPKLLNVDKDLLLIPSVAIHMDRSANEGKNYNANVDLLPLLGSAGTAEGFAGLIARWAGVEKEQIAGSDLFLYPRGRGFLWGGEEEYISSPRLDDLQCVFGCLQGLLQAGESRSAQVLCVFDNEEVGSASRQGADSGFLEDVLLRLCGALGLNGFGYRQKLANSFMVSADNAHAVHPNHPEYADSSERPELNRGPVIKHNAEQRYTTDGFTAALFAEICHRAGVPVQHYSNRADLRGGSTLGNVSSAHVSVPCVDVGIPQLAMHAAWESAGAKDTEYFVKAAKTFYESSFRMCENAAEI